MIPPESEILPSLDDSDDNFSDDLDDDEDLDDDQDTMMADEPLETMEEEDEDEDYESDEDSPVIDQDFMNDGNFFVAKSFNQSHLISIADLVTSTPAPTTTSSTTASSVDYAPSQASTQAPEKPSEIPISQPSNDNIGTSIPTPDPYFTHFDPRMEHQSYKVGLDVKKLLNNSRFIDMHDCNHRRHDAWISNEPSAKLFLFLLKFFFRRL